MQVDLQAGTAEAKGGLLAAAAAAATSKQRRSTHAYSRMGHAAAPMPLFSALWPLRARSHRSILLQCLRRLLPSPAMAPRLPALLLAATAVSLFLWGPAGVLASGWGPGSAATPAPSPSGQPAAPTSGGGGDCSSLASSITGICSAELNVCELPRSGAAAWQGMWGRMRLGLSSMLAIRRCRKAPHAAMCAGLLVLYHAHAICCTPAPRSGSNVLANGNGSAD